MDGLFLLIILANYFIGWVSYISTFGYRTRFSQKASLTMALFGVLFITLIVTHFYDVYTKED
jgi:hypothetical protein